VLEPAALDVAMSPSAFVCSGSKPKFNTFRDHLLKRGGSARCLPADVAISSEKGPLPLERVCPDWTQKSPRLVCKS
jgi:hypothetical protein